LSRGPAILLAFDYGERRIGVAVGQTASGTATAIGTVGARGTPDWTAVLRCITEWQPHRLLVGLPYNMDGSETAMTSACRRFASELGQRTSLPVDLVDERLTSAAAAAELRDARRSGERARRVRRGDVDAHAARLILETWLRAARPDEEKGS
jgi:putative Holliday junction resolvase